MKLYYLVLVLIFEAETGSVDVNGQISIKVNGEAYFGEGRIQRGSENGVTAAPAVECTYQMPEEAQARALLSNMMNELTKMFVKVHKIMKTNLRRKAKATRFRVVSKKQTEFFEDIYKNMSKQYLSFYKSKTDRVDRSGRNKDPCENQTEMKQLWQELLDNSLSTFLQAALKCVDENLKSKGKEEDTKMREMMSLHVYRKLKKIRIKHLTLLCDKFQLCYNEFIERNDKRAK